MIPPLTSSRRMSVDRKVYRYNVAGGGAAQPPGSVQADPSGWEKTVNEGPAPCVLDPADEDEDEEVTDELRLADDVKVVDDIGGCRG